MVGPAHDRAVSYEKTTQCTVIEEANLFLVHSVSLAVPIFVPRVGLDTLHALIPKICWPFLPDLVCL